MALYHVTPSLLYAINGILANYLSGDAYGNACEIFKIIVYIAIFILPSFFICRLIPSKDKTHTDFKLSPKLIFAVIGSIGVISIASHFSALLQNTLSVFGIYFHRPSFSVPGSIFGVVLFVIYSALTPAIVEELLFRKVILNRLTPYGKTFAVLFSAFLFSIMHSNPSQFIYAFVGGVILGSAAVISGSVTLPFIIHLANNSLSVSYIIMYDRLSKESFNKISSAIDLLFRIFGILLLCYLFSKGFFTKKEQSVDLGFSKSKTATRLFLILYILYSLFLSLRWVYII